MGTAIWDVKTGKKLNVLRYSKGVRSLRLRPGSRWLVGAYGHNVGEASIWDIDSGMRLCRVKVSDESLFWAEISPDGKTLVTTGLGGQIKLWKLGQKTVATKLSKSG